MPDWKTEIRRQLAPLKLVAAREAEIVEELSQHADDRYRELQSEGVADAQARRTVLDELRTLAREMHGVETPAAPVIELGAASRGPALNGLGQDVHYALRTFRKNPGFAATAMLALAFGIGANTAIFSVVNAVLLRPLPYPEPQRLVRIYEGTQSEAGWSVAYPNFLDWRRESHSFAAMAATRHADFNFTGAGEPEQISGQYVSTELFPMLGVRTLLGRGFLPQDDRPGASCSVILTYALWRERFGSDPNIVSGRSLRLNGRDCSVVGVLPADFHLSEEARLFVPIEQSNDPELRMRESRGQQVYARLKPGVSMAAAQAELSSIARELSRRYPKENGGFGVKLAPMKDDIVGDVRSTLLLLVGAV